MRIDDSGGGEFLEARLVMELNGGGERKAVWPAI